MSDDASELVGASAVMKAVRASVRQAARSTKPVLIVGEAGTGKSLAAQTIHALSSRSARPFARLHCAAVTESLLVAELFGSVSSGGLFSATPTIKPGQVELGEGGTLFIDEVGELATHSQAVLLRLIEENSYLRLGSAETLNADVRVVASTHRSLPDCVKAGTFREDLCARLSGVKITLPPLRERPGDLEVLVLHFLAKHGPKDAAITHGALAHLAARHWPGNVRDLENFICMMLSKAPSGLIDEAIAEKRPIVRE